MPHLEAAGRPTQAASWPPTAWTTTTSWASGRGSSTSSPTSARRQARMFRHLLIDEMQDTNSIQAHLVETIARAGAGNLTAVGDDAQSIYKFRGANYDNILKFPERNPRTAIFRLETNYRSTPEIVAFTNASIAPQRVGLPQDARLGPRAGRPAPGRPRRRRGRGGRLPLPADPRTGRRGASAWARWRSSTGTTTTASSSRPSWSPAGSPTRSGAASGSSSRPTSRTSWPTSGSWSTPSDEPAWRRLLMLLPGVGPAKASALCAT